MADFEIVTHGLPALATEWLQAQRLLDAELPCLTDEDRQRARRTLRTEEQYRRHLAFRRFAKEREAAEAEVLGRQIAIILSELGERYTLKLVERLGEPSGWKVSIQSGNEVSDVYVMDADRLRASTGWLRSYLSNSLGREDALRPAS